LLHDRLWQLGRGLSSILVRIRICCCCTGAAAVCFDSPGPATAADENIIIIIITIRYTTVILIATAVVSSISLVRDQSVRHTALVASQAGPLLSPGC
jgi:hypothetical protein